jgi:hypothetical protein
MVQANTLYDDTHTRQSSCLRTTSVIVCLPAAPLNHPRKLEEVSDRKKNTALWGGAGSTATKHSFDTIHQPWSMEPCHAIQQSTHSALRHAHARRSATQQSLDTIHQPWTHDDIITSSRELTFQLY